MLAFYAYLFLCLLIPMLAYPMLAYFLMTVTTPSAVSLMMLEGL